MSCVELSYIVYLEDAWVRARRVGGKCRGVIVIDIADCGFDMLNHISTIRRIAENGVLRYPEISEKVYLINAGWFISTLWGAIQPFLPTRTVQKLSILRGGDNQNAVLSEYIVGGLETIKEPFPVLSVEAAYGVLITEILASDPGHLPYPDSKEFLIAALSFSRKALEIEPDDEFHINRINEIELFLGMVSE
jgi:hypothetical protein